MTPVPGPGGGRRPFEDGDEAEGQNEDKVPGDAGPGVNRAVGGLAQAPSGRMTSARATRPVRLAGSGSRSWWLAGLTLGLVVAAVLALDRLYPPDLSRHQQRSAELLDRDGQLLRALPTADGAWRLGTTRAEVDPLFLRLLVAIEDQRFRWHVGVDPLALVRAAGQYLRQGRVISGGSTLDMQTARLLRPGPRTLANKLQELLRALQLRARYGRDGVLDLYLTLAPYGGTLEGVRAASLGWFGKEPAHLSPAEAALLVALPQSPERLRPDRFPDAARAARDRVLLRAAARGVIGPEVAAAAMLAPIPGWQQPLPRRAAHLADQLLAGAPPGLTLRSTVEARLQRELEHLARVVAAGYRRGEFAPAEAAMAAEVNLAVRVLRNRDGAVLAHLGSADWLECQLDLGRAVRSPGSTLKPFFAQHSGGQGAGARRGIALCRAVARRGGRAATAAGTSTRSAGGPWRGGPDPG